MYLSTTYARRRRRAAVSVFAAAGVAVALAACGGSSTNTSAGHSSTGTTGTGATTAKHSGDVKLLSAGSLDTLMTNSLGPAFHKATGYTLVNTSAGSSTLAADIKNKVQVADVFASASPAVTATLMGAQGGNWVHWYANFASSPLVLAYNPKSKFANDLKTKPWWKVITMPGFRLGRTNPTQDPGGVLDVKALTETAIKQHDPAVAKIIKDSSTEYEETAEQAGIQNGQLDASFMYEADANAQKSPFVPLTGTNEQGSYTVTILRNAPNPAGAAAFVKFLVSPTGQALMKADHFGIISPPKLVGVSVPADLVAVLK